ncbi:hypothetical protein [Vibrio breoganii]|uniref:hypothetical protein n=1 Tax=Vibrio breoganii TaxID=553239 RepID=UPI000C867311|nr:hypothetical protein [Vibrio breoganii]PMG08566.1 hypothetical protein BCV00_18640 [Vibrio breoganii]PMG98996.1 hypothetical protein BCU79_18795 [Vibrio breoganii]
MRKLLLTALVVASFSVNADVFKEAEAGLKSQLKDPESLQLRNMYESSIGVCGEFNAKNSNDGYVGFQNFHVTLPFSGKSSVSMSDDSPVTKIICKK